MENNDAPQSPQPFYSDPTLREPQSGWGNQPQPQWAGPPSPSGPFPPGQPPYPSSGNFPQQGQYPQPPYSAPTQPQPPVPPKKTRRLLWVALVLMLVCVSIVGVLIVKGFGTGKSRQQTTASSNATATSATSATSVTSVAPTTVAIAAAASIFFIEIEQQNYTVAYQNSDFKSTSLAAFQTASQQYDQTFGKLTAFKIGPVVITPTNTSIQKAVVEVYLTRERLPNHVSGAVLTFNVNTWQITDGTSWS